MYIQLVLHRPFVGRKTSREKGDAGDADPTLGWEPAGRSGALDRTYSSRPSCPPAPWSPVPTSTRPIPPCPVPGKPRPPRDWDKDGGPRSSGSSPHSGTTGAPRLGAGRQRGSSINEAFNDGYRLVLQASESHLNSGNFKLFWQYKRA